MNEGVQFLIVAAALLGFMAGSALERWAHKWDREMAKRWTDHVMREVEANLR